MKNFFKKRLNNLDLKNQIDNIFDSFYEGVNWSKKRAFSDLDPVVELREFNEKFLLKMEAPGLSKKDINIQVDEKMVILEGEKIKEKTEKEDDFCHYSEFSYGKFKRIIKLPKSIDIDGVKASFTDGILKIDLKKSEKTRNKKVIIE